MSGKIPAVGWIPPLVEPYLRGYRADGWRLGSMKGYNFVAKTWKGHRGRKLAETGFFVGFLSSEEGFSFLTPQPPECIVFGFVNPPNSVVYRRLVKEPESVFRKTAEYIGWLTHRPPRFVFHEDQIPVLTRHQSMCEWPASRCEHFSRNFFIETLAWLVRSGLVRKLLSEPLDEPTPGGTSKPR